MGARFFRGGQERQLPELSQGTGGAGRDDQPSPTAVGVLTLPSAGSPDVAVTRTVARHPAPR